jgi:predicted nucleic acid-binding protein
MVAGVPVVLAERLDTIEIATFDERHFRVVRGRRQAVPAPTG